MGLFFWRGRKEAKWLNSAEYESLTKKIIEISAQLDILSSKCINLETQYKLLSSKYTRIKGKEIDEEMDELMKSSTTDKDKKSDPFDSVREMRKHGIL